MHADQRSELLKLLTLSLLLAVEQTQIEKVSELFAVSGAYQPDHYAVNSALTSAAYRGNIAMVKRLLGLTSHNRPTKQGLESALCFAVERGDKNVNVIEKLLSVSIDKQPRKEAIDDAIQRAESSLQFAHHDEDYYLINQWTQVLDTLRTYNEKIQDTQNQTDESKTFKK